MLQRVKGLFWSQSGKLTMAKEELILVTGMVSSVAAFIGVSVSWDTLFGSPAQLVDDLIKIEMANSEFYERHRMWPHQTTNGDAYKNASALVTPFAMRPPYSNLQSFKNLIPDFEIQSKTYRVKHDYGNGGLVGMKQVSRADGDYIQIQLDNVPIREADEVDLRIDGERSANAGRVTLEYDLEAGTATVLYLANQI